MSEESAESGAVDRAQTRAWNRLLESSRDAASRGSRRLSGTATRHSTQRERHHDGRAGWQRRHGCLGRVDWPSLEPDCPLGSVQRIDVSDSGALVVQAWTSMAASSSRTPAALGRGQRPPTRPDMRARWRSVQTNSRSRPEAQGDIHLWDARSGDHRFALQNGTGNVLALAFSPEDASWPPIAVATSSSGISRRARRAGPFVATTPWCSPSPSRPRHAARVGQLRQDRAPVESDLGRRVVPPGRDEQCGKRDRRRVHARRQDARDP